MLTVIPVLMAGGLNLEAVETLPFVELDPYPVEAEALPWMPERAELAKTGRLLLGGAASPDRSASWLSLADLQESGVARLEDLFWRVAGADSPARFGVVTVPNVRGDAAESLWNGQRRGDNLFGLTPTFTAVESVELIKGPPLLRTGPGKRTGGLFNTTTKRPVPGETFAMVDLRLGSWLPDGDSYQTVEVTLDLNLPLAKGQALRLAAGYRDDETAYHRNGGRDDYRDLYLAWQRQDGAGALLDLVFYYLDSDRPQTLGVNRPWQGLIDHNDYLGGGVDPLIGQGDPPGFLDPGIADPGLIVSDAADLVKLERDRVLLSLGDSGSGDLFLGQVRWRKPLGPDLEFEQSVMLEEVQREKFHAFLYAEEVDQLTLDSLSRLMGRSLNRFGEMNWEAGLALRLEERDNRTNYWNEFAYAYDLTTGRRFDALEQFAAWFAPGAVTDAEGNQWYLPSSLYGTPETTVSQVRQAGLYGQLEQDLGNGWNLSGGLRLDAFDLEAREPGDLAGSAGWKDAQTVEMASFHLSLRKTWDRATQYVAAGWYDGIAGNTVGDGLNLYPPGEFNTDDFDNRSRLLEWGGSWKPTDAFLLSWAAFDQKRRRQEFYGANDIQVRGVELEMEWQVSEPTRLMLTLNHLDARYDNAAPAEFGGGSLWNVYAPGAGPEGKGNGFGYIGGFFLNSLPPADYRIPGLSDWTLSAGLRQDLAEDWHLQVWGTWQSAQDGNLAAEYTIPDQMEWNAAVSYSPGKWEFQVIARNLFDADNWIHNGDTFFDQMLVSRALPLRLEGRVRVRF